jgi:hypothetical protein
MTIRVESDDWGAGPNILDAQTLTALRSALEETPLIVEHRFYRGSRSPERRVFDDFELLDEYVRAAPPGDSFWVWRYDSLCRDENAFVHAKRPHVDGTVPGGGAY